jgi:hydroxyacylglutathione hydrolase
MSQEIKTIPLQMPLKLGAVNCYLIKTGASYVLIDTGSSNQCATLEQELTSAGCRPGNLNLIVITHGDFDHTGNASYLRSKFNTKIAMHRDDLSMIEHGDMFANRKKGNPIIGVLAKLFSGFGKAQQCSPDITIDEGFDLSEYGCAAQVLSIPGHSRGSIGILTASGDLFCGDLLENIKIPALGSIMDDPETARASLEKLRGLPVNFVYPGHGQPFPIEVLHYATDSPSTR